jgi:hypothetical protein
MDNNTLILVLGVGVILLIGFAVWRSNKMQFKGKAGQIEAEMNTEAKPEPANAPAKQAGAQLEAGSIDNSTVVTADPSQQHGSATTKVGGAISGSTVITTTGHVNIGQIVGAAAQPQQGATTPNRRTVGLPPDPSRTEVLDALTTHFNLSELETLCFDLRIDADSVAGADKMTKARNLVTYCERRQRFADLVAAIRAPRS